MADKIQNIIFKYIVDSKQAEKASKEVSAALKGVQGTSKGVGKTLDSLGSKFTTFLSVAAVTAAINKSIDNFRKFEKAAASLQGILGATAEEVKFFKDAALELGPTYGRSASEVVKAFELVGSAKPELLQSQEALKQVTEQALLLAQASGLELTTAVDSLTGTLNQFGLGGDAAAKTVDILAAGAQKGAVAIPNLTEAIRTAGAEAAGLGLSVTQTAALVETLGEKAIVGADGGIKLRNILLTLQKEGIGFKDGVFDLNSALDELAAKNLSGAERAKLFEKANSSAAAQLIENRARVAELTTELDTNGIATEQAAANANTLDFKIAQLDSTLEAFSITLTDKFAPAISGTVDFLTNMINLIGDDDPFSDASNNIENYFRSWFGMEELTDEQIAMNRALQSIGETAANNERIVDSYTVTEEENTGAIKENTRAEQVNSATKAKATELTKAQIAEIKRQREEMEALVGNVEAVDKVFRRYLGPLEQTRQELEELNAKGLKEANERAGDASMNFERLANMFGTAEEAAAALSDGMDELARQEKFEATLQKIGQITEGLQIASDFVGVLGEAFAVQSQNRLLELEREREAEIAKEGISADERAKIEAKFEAKREELQKKAAAKEKAIAITKSVIATALSVGNALASPPGPPVTIPFAVLAGALGGAQTAIIAAQKFASGVIDLKGPGTETSDSIPAYLSRGETVFPARTTRQYRNTIEAVYYGRIPAHVLEDFVSNYSGGNFNYTQTSTFSDRGIIGATKGSGARIEKKIGATNRLMRRMIENGPYYKKTRNV